MGAGPAGIYAADLLTKSETAVSVDIFERLPAPFGLVRYGVAPDHPRIKQIIVALEKVLGRGDVRLLTNVDFGTDVTLEELRHHYDAVVFSTGSIKDATLATVTAASQLGEVHLLVAGSCVGAVAEAAAKIAGAGKVHVADGAHLEHQLAEDVAHLALRLGVEQWISLGAVPGAVSHTMPVPVMATASEGGQLGPGNIAGPEGLLRVPSAALSAFEMAVSAAGIPAVGFFAQVPPYASIGYAAASLALLHRLARHLGVALEVGPVKLLEVRRAGMPVGRARRDLLPAPPDPLQRSQRRDLRQLGAA